MTVARHILFPLAFPVQEQFHVVRVRIHPNIHQVPFRFVPARTFLPEIPVRRYVQHVLVCPPALIIVVDVLRETAHIHQPEMRIDIRPLVRGGFTAVIQPGPHKSSQPEIIGRGQGPPGLGRTGPPGSGNVLVGYIAPDRIFFIDTSCGNGASHFRSDDRLSRVVAVIVRYGKLPVIKTSYRDHLIDPIENIRHIRCISAGAGGVQFLLFRDKGLRDPFPGAAGMDPSFFVTDRPHEYAGPAPVPFDEPLKLVHVFGPAVEQSLLIHDQHAQAVAGIQ